jgi:hypothetical protein
MWAMENLTKDRNEGVLKALQCPRCKEYMVPPISFCENGHNICSRCRGKVKRCFNCQEPYLRGTNMTLEAIARQVLYPCIYKENGCQDSFPVNLILDHQDNCRYSAFGCPIVLVGPKICPWKGSLSQMRDHLLNNHNNYIWEGNGEHISKKTGVTATGLYNEVIIAFGEIFYVQFRGQDRNYYGLVKYIGPKGQAKEYKSSVSIVSKDGIEKVSACYATSSYVEDTEDVIADGKCLKLHFDVVRKLLDNDGNMYTSVEISKLPTSEPLYDGVGT